MELQKVRHDWVTELNWTEQYFRFSLSLSPAQWLAILAFQIIILTFCQSVDWIFVPILLFWYFWQIYPLQLFTPSALSVSPHSQDGQLRWRRGPSESWRQANLRGLSTWSRSCCLGLLIFVLHLLFELKDCQFVPVASKIHACKILLCAIFLRKSWF